MKSSWAPAIVLFFLAPMIGELLSGSSPPVSYFHVPTIVILSILYGGGALLIREYTLRWGKGWYARAWLAAAYGIWEEGFLVGSWFNPQWPDIKDLGSYGWFLHTNWVWATGLTLYHGTVSTLVPILLVELLFPEQRNERWLSDRALKWVTGIFAVEGLMGSLVVCFRIFHGSYPIVLDYLTLIPIAYLISRARKAPAADAAVPERSGAAPAPWKFALAGLAAIFLMFILQKVFQEGRAPILVPVVAVGLMAALLARWMERASGHGRAWTDRHRLAAAIGPLLFLIAIGPLMEFVAHPPKNMAGEVFVDLAFVVFLIYLWRAVRKREGSAAPPVAAGPTPA